MGIRVFVHDDAVEVTFDGLDRWLALSTGERIAMTDITDTRIASVAELKADLGWRVGGTYWPFATPRRVIAGHFTDKRRKGTRQLWDVRNAEDVLVIDTRLERPARIVLEVPDPADVIWLVGERLPQDH